MPHYRQQQAVSNIIIVQDPSTIRHPHHSPSPPFAISTIASLFITSLDDRHILIVDEPSWAISFLSPAAQPATLTTWRGDHSIRIRRLVTELHRQLPTLRRDEWEPSFVDYNLKEICVRMQDGKQKAYVSSIEAMKLYLWGYEMLLQLEPDLDDDAVVTGQMEEIQRLMDKLPATPSALEEDFGRRLWERKSQEWLKVLLRLAMPLLEAR